MTELRKEEDVKLTEGRAKQPCTTCQDIQMTRDDSSEGRRALECHATEASNTP
jgi:hypothetical protein